MRIARLAFPLMKGVEAVMLNNIMNIVRYPKAVGCLAMAAGTLVAAQPICERNTSSDSDWLIGMVDQILDEQKKRAIQREKEWKEAAVEFERIVGQYEALCKKDMKGFIQHKIYQYIQQQKRKQHDKNHDHKHK